MRYPLFPGRRVLSNTIWLIQPRCNQCTKTIRMQISQLSMVGNLFVQLGEMSQCRLN